MRLIDEQHTACPFYGSRRMTAWLTQQGEPVNRKRVQRLDRKSTRLNSSHLGISYAVFCLKKKIMKMKQSLSPSRTGIQTRQDAWKTRACCRCCRTSRRATGGQAFERERRMNDARQRRGA